MKVMLAGLGLACAAFGACTCAETGMVRYGSNSDRKMIVKVESDAATQRCAAVWIAATEIRPTGDPYHFHLERIRLRTRRVAACDASAETFVRRDKTYQFVFDANSSAIRELRPVENADVSASNQNLWTAIAAGNRKTPLPAARIDPSREWNRSAWVLARRKIRGYFVGRVQDAGQQEKLVPLPKSRIIQAGQLGQIEAVSDRSAIVRFYEGSRAEAFSARRNALRRWYANLGGPYSEGKDDLYTAIRAEILEVSITDLVEVNDYLDARNSDRT